MRATFLLFLATATAFTSAALALQPAVELGGFARCQARAALRRAAAAPPRCSALTAPELDQSCRLAFDEFLSQFCGHFDNLEQALEDRRAGRPPREGGGHEHIHCHLQPLALERPAVLANYYFNGDPARPFRQRLYTLQPTEVRRSAADGEIRMQIFRLAEQVEAQLRAASGDAAAVAWDAERDLAEELLIPGCDVFWRRVGGHFEGEMATASALVHSPLLGREIVVTDHLHLWEGALWVNDRGCGTDGTYLYGNTRDVPYKMNRVRWSSHRGEPVWEDRRAA